MAFVDIDALLAEYIKAGIDADILPGAHTRSARRYRSNPYPRGPQMLDRHHTAQNSAMSEWASIQYMTFWAKYPVMCNTYPWKDGRLTICAAGPTYTAGAGGPLGDVRSGNAEGWSMEIGNNGIGERYSEAQQETIVKATAVEIAFFGERWKGKFTRDRVPAHFEWAPGRKIDPSGPSRWNDYRNTKWDMGRFRKEVYAKYNELYGGNKIMADIYEVSGGPYRAVDSRVWPGEHIASGQVHRFNVGEQVPRTAKGILATVTATQPKAAGHISVSRPGERRVIENTSCLNFAAGQTVPNTTLIYTHNGQYDFRCSADTHVIVDVLGYLA